MLHPRTSAGLTKAGEIIDGQFEPGFLCYGVPIGTDRYVRHMMEVKVEELAVVAEATVKVLQNERQTLWTVLRSSLSQQLDYWLQLCYPSDVMVAAKKMDEILWQVLQVAVGSGIPREDDGSDWGCIPVVPVKKLTGRTYQEWLVRQPIRFGGCGVRSQTDLSPLAFIGALEQTIPFFIGDRGVCPQLSHLVGEHGEVEKRWEPLLQSGCRTGRELTDAWKNITDEAKECSTYLNQEIDPVFVVPVQGVGEGNTNGKTRNQLLEKREIMRGQVLTRALERLPNKLLRPVLAWPELDKLSNAWLLALP